MTYLYRAPARLEEDWKSGVKTPPDTMREELREDIDRLAGMIDAGDELMPIEGRVSDYKSWLAAVLGDELEDRGYSVTMFSPQRTNRDSAVDKLGVFGADYVEHPSRFDLCIWDEWRDNVGHVDKATCDAINCPYYLEHDGDKADRAADSMSAHRLRTGGTELDTEEFRDWGEEQHACPAQLYLASRGLSATDGAVDASTYAKAFTDRSMHDDGSLDSDVVVLDEAHTLASDPEVVADNLDPASLLGNLEVVLGNLEDRAERWATRVLRELRNLGEAISEWLERSWEEPVTPRDLFADTHVTLVDSFHALDTVEGRLTQSMNRSIGRDDWDTASVNATPFEAVKDVRGFLSNIASYREGRADFVHSLYQEGGDTVNDMAFRAVDQSMSVDDGGTTPGAVYREWEERGTHPAITDRWGPILDAYIRSLWDGRTVSTHEGLPGAPVTPMGRLRQLCGADTVVTLSATHNELSDPTREPDRLRPTRHKLLTAPVNLRADGSEREDFDGRRSVTPETPWFRDMFHNASETSGDRVAAVPINFANREKWDGMAVERLETENGDVVKGIVPHSAGSIGEKGLEELDIDTVAAGIQVQGPAATARRLVTWWEFMAPRRDSPGDVLADSWRMLAQHAVSGTIQAAGRFDWDADTLVFERPGLFELAGFEVERATPEHDGFPGAFVDEYRGTFDEWRDKRDAARAAKVVRYLDRSERKTPSPPQLLSEYARVYDCDREEAERAVWLSTDGGRIEPTDSERGVRFRVVKQRTTYNANDE